MVPLRHTQYFFHVRFGANSTLRFLWISQFFTVSQLQRQTQNYKNSILKLNCINISIAIIMHDDVIKWKHFLRYWPFVQGIHRSPANSPHKGQWHGALMFSLICAWINGWVDNHEAGDLRCHCAHYDVIVMRYTEIARRNLFLWLKQ